MNKRYLLALCIILLSISEYAVAQLNPLGAQYYNNQYLANPAFAGQTQGLKLNGAYRKLWAGIPGAPTTQSITADYGFTKVGVGINVNNETAGLLKYTRALASYAYHIPFNKEGTRLSFGLSLGLLSQRVDRDEINGNPDDITVGEYGDRNYFDGDFGAAFTTGGLTLQAAVPNLKSFFKKDDIKTADVVTFFSAASYRIPLNNGMELEPKIAYRGVKGFDNLFDVGTQFALADKKFMLMGFYHSNESATFGFGVDLKKRYLLSGMYTTQTAPLGGHTNGSFEINLRVALGK
jgi:type IX secretion system PorP/SprF family membrane protein